jgi:beta-lactamase regulating signal transducer with metallopeptidase domain
MSQLIETANGWSETWLQLVVAVLWQFTVLAAVAALIAFSLRRSAPALRYWLWQIVAIKLLLMPFWIVWVPLPSFFRTPENRVARNTQADRTSGGVGEASPSPSAALPLGGPAVSTDAEPLPGRTLLGQITWASWMLLAWLIVVMWQLVRVLHQRLQLGRLLRRAVPATDSRLNMLLAELSHQLGLRGAPAALFTDRECSPFVFGLWRPMLVLPQGLLDTLDSIQLRAGAFARAGPRQAARPALGLVA